MCRQLLLGKIMFLPLFLHLQMREKKEKRERKKVVQRKDITVAANVLSSPQVGCATSSVLAEKIKCYKRARY